ncbi:MAG TPA: hypothetical protein VID95_00465 [Candidatus Limnocylindrales bacterium]|jgi:hypothetical protein
MIKRTRHALRPFARAARAFVEEPRRADPFARRRDPGGPELVRVAPIVEVPRPDEPRVTLLMPGLEMARMTGGPNTALNLVARLAVHGVPLRILAAIRPIDDRPELVREHIEQLVGGPLGPATSLGAVDPEHPLEVAPDDVFIATSWETAYLAAAALPHTSAPAFVYLIQDFEAGFFAWSTPHALALATYRMPVRPIFNERFLRDHFVSQHVGDLGLDGGASWTSFEPSVDRDLFRSSSGTGTRRRLVFYGRPRNERNCFDLGLRAIRLAVQRGALDPARWDVVSVGADVPELDLGHGQTLRPSPWLDYRSYAAFISSSDLMLALMLSPHTSYPPLEMAATGGRVVTNVFSSKTAEGLRRISPSLVAVEPDPEAIADAILEVGSLVEAEGNGDRPAARLDLPSSWEEAFRDTIPWLLATIADLRGTT